MTRAAILLGRWIAGTVSIVLLPLAGAMADNTYAKPLAVVDGWSVLRGSYLFHKGKCTLIKDMESGGNPQLQIHPDPDNSGQLAALLVNLEVIRAGLKLKYEDANADITRVTSSLDGGEAEPIEMIDGFKWSSVYAHRGNELLSAREMVVLIYFMLGNKSKGHFEVRYSLNGLASAVRWFENEKCR